MQISSRERGWVLPSREGFRLRGTLGETLVSEEWVLPSREGEDLPSREGWVLPSRERVNVLVLFIALKPRVE